MSTIRSYRRITNKEARDFIAARAPFTANSLRGEVNYGICLPAVIGRLNREEYDRLVTDADYAERMHRPLYVVYSYDTPIAWAVGDADGYMVSQRFSPTTSRHQGIVPAINRTHGEECMDDDCRMTQTDCGCLAWSCETFTSRDGEYPSGLVTCSKGYGCEA
jgi:hypothetical protein